jgi:hypothetical protein
MRISAADAAMFLHDAQFTVLAAEGGGLSAVGRFGAGGTALIMMILAMGLKKSGKADGKPWILVVVGVIMAASFAAAGGFLTDLQKLALDLTGMVNNLGMGEATPAAIGVGIGLILWLFKLKPMQRILWGFLGYSAWSAADGSLFVGLTDLSNHIVQRFS